MALFTPLLSLIHSNDSIHQYLSAIIYIIIVGSCNKTNMPKNQPSCLTQPHVPDDKSSIYDLGHYT